MFVISVEGPGYVNKRLWSTHKIVAVYPTREEAMERSDEIEKLDESVFLLTDLDTGKVERLQ